MRLSTFKIWFTILIPMFLFANTEKSISVFNKSVSHQNIIHLKSIDSDEIAITKINNNLFNKIEPSRFINEKQKLKTKILKREQSYLINNNTREECEEGQVEDCSGDGDCCPEEWIGDDFTDCDDQQWGCDLSCYDNDGGDCDDSNDDGGHDGDCADGYVEDCSGDGDCCDETWIGDDFADCDDQEWGCDLSCHENDGGLCDEDYPSDYDAVIFVGNSGENQNGLIVVPIYYTSTVPMAGIQFTLADDPNAVSAVEFESTHEDCFSANFNDIEGVIMGILFSIEGCEYPSSNEPVHVANIYYELEADAFFTLDIGLHFLDAIASDTNGNALHVATEGGVISTSLSGDVNLDGEVNVADIVSLVNFILYFDEPTELQFYLSDMNSDGELNIVDVVLIVNLILD